MSDRGTDREDDEQQQSSGKISIDDQLTRSDVEAPRKPFGEGDGS